MENFDNLMLKAFTAIVLTLILATSGCSVIKANIAKDLIKGGTDPIAVQCLLFAESSNATCVILASKK